MHRVWKRNIDETDRKNTTASTFEKHFSSKKTKLKIQFIAVRSLVRKGMSIRHFSMILLAIGQL